MTPQTDPNTGQVQTPVARPKVLILPTSRTPAGAREAIAAGSRPRIDYLDLEAHFGATVIDWSVYDRGLARVMTRFDRTMRLAWAQAWHVLSHWEGYDVVYSMGEDVGLALAWLMRRRGIQTRHILISHNLLSPPKVPLVRVLDVMPSFAAIVVMTRSAVDPIGRTYAGVEDRLVNLPNFVDEQFWRSDRATSAPQDEIMKPILSVGRAKRDYGSLVMAVAGLPVRLRLQASSQWHVSDGVLPHGVPTNVTLGGYLSPTDLRELYAQSRFVVVPLRPGPHNFAGTESILEAMAMGKAVILAADYCPTDYLVPGETGVHVPAGDVSALRQAIAALLASPEKAAAMGRAGRRWLESHIGYDSAIRRLADLAVVGNAAAKAPIERPGTAFQKRVARAA